MANTAQLNALRAAIVSFANKVKLISQSTAYADNAGQLEGLTLAQVVSLISGATDSTIRDVELSLQAYMDRRDNPNQVNKEQVGLGNLQNFSIATEAQAKDEAVVNAYMTPQRTWEALLHFWADKVGAAPETLDTIEELAAAFQNNPDIIEGLQTQVANKATRTELNAAVAQIEQQLQDFVDQAALTYATKSELSAQRTLLENQIQGVQTQVTTLQGTVATKASQEALDALTAVVATKASSSSVNELATLVDSKADSADLVAAITTLENAFADAIAALD